ncbi:hypothetical protein TRFO_13051 [Tritrichomonas foetus]|uniref:Uncharacterized protein n=1 Tax=Tritrichomonas foetus TaxID=1144522 RepID=A0A1J4L3V2_9EUKA|nr:hypothetical protein TRFO_13051 [Tritrichomonas foetus]|eukprot:OHT16630.1 hypothetical protein TRFO_13051 [Tritrichomonas foetus]
MENRDAKGAAPQRPQQPQRRKSQHSSSGSHKDSFLISSVAELHNHLKEVLEYDNSIVGKAEQLMEIASKIDIFENRLKYRHNKLSEEKQILENKMKSLNGKKDVIRNNIDGEIIDLEQKFDVYENQLKHVIEQSKLITPIIEDAKKRYHELCNQLLELKEIKNKIQIIIENQTEIDISEIKNEVEKTKSNILRISHKIEKFEKLESDIERYENDIKRIDGKVQNKINQKKEIYDHIINQNCSEINKIKKYIRKQNRIYEKIEIDEKKNLINSIIHNISNIGDRLNHLKTEKWKILQQIELQRQYSTFKKNKYQAMREYFIDQIEAFPTIAFPSKETLSEIKETFMKKRRSNDRLQRMEAQLKKLIVTESKVKNNMKKVNEKILREGNLSILLDKLDSKLNEICDESVKFSNINQKYVQEKALLQFLNEIQQNVFLKEKEEIYLKEKDKELILPKFPIENIQMKNQNELKLNKLSTKFEEIQKKILSMLSDIDNLQNANEKMKKQINQLTEQKNKLEKKNYYQNHHHNNNVNEMYADVTDLLAGKRKEIYDLSQLVEMKKKSISSRKKKLERSCEHFFTIIQEYGRTWRDAATNPNLPKHKLIFYNE